MTLISSRIGEVASTIGRSLLDIASSQKQHQRRVRLTRTLYPVVILLALSTFVVLSLFERLVTSLQFQAFLSTEFGAISDGYVRTFDLGPSGRHETREVRFEKLEGTGLKDSPLQLGALAFDVFRDGDLRYRAQFDDAVLDMLAKEIRAPDDVTLAGPDGLRASMSSAVLNIETFALSTDADVLVFSDGGVSLSATHGMDLDVRTGDLTLRGAASAQIPPVLPDLE